MAKRAAEDKELKAELLANVAEQYYLRGRTQDEISDDVHKHPTTVARLLEEARQLGVVSFDIDPRFGLIGWEDQNLARALEDRLDLNAAVVINMHGSRAKSSRRRARPSDLDDKRLKDTHRAQDDPLHMALANQAGLRIREVIAPEGHVAVGSGRAVYQAVRAIKRRPPKRKKVRVSPLSGRLWAHSWDVEGPTILRPLDADDAAFVLASAFENQRVSFSQVAHPLFSTNPDEAQRIMAEHCPFHPGGKWRNDDTPEIAIVGFGSVDPKSGHRIADLFGEGEQLKGIEQYLTRAKADLEKIWRLTEANHLPYFADINNRYYPVLPLPAECGDLDLAAFETSFGHVKAHLDELHRRMVVAEWAHLRSIRSVVAIAGGPFKWRAIWTALLVGYFRRSARVVTELYTDAETADALVKAFDALDRSPQDLQDWYRSLSERIFDRL